MVGHDGIDSDHWLIEWNDRVTMFVRALRIEEPVRLVFNLMTSNPAATPKPDSWPLAFDRERNLAD